MREDLLQYIWEFQQFDKRRLVTEAGQVLRVVKTGKSNGDAGPDFLEAQLVVENTVLYGHVEIHVRSSYWYTHKHDKDRAYNNVVLHVVWEDDKSVVNGKGEVMATLVLKKYVNKDFIGRYKELVEVDTSIPCSSVLYKVGKRKWTGMLKRVLLYRLGKKYVFVDELLKKNKSDSEATAYQLLAYNFGFKANSASFLHLSKLVPFKLIQKHAPSLIHLEALLLGQAGLLSAYTVTEENDDYINELIEVYKYIKYKYRLKVSMSASDWKFFRLRPANSPFIRITQFASFLHHDKSVFYTLINTPVSKLYKSLAIKQGTYWQTHYQPNRKSKKIISGLGESSIHGILINTTVPLLVAYGKLRDNEFYVNRALDILKKLPGEKNVITAKWKRLGFHIGSAFDSQASIELFNNFCLLKRCLSCDIGKHILRRK